MPSRYNAPPQWYRFNSADQERAEKAFWRMPIRLVEDGVLARLGPSAAPVLYVLALHTWSGKGSKAAGWIGGAQAIKQGELWTPWQPLSLRRIATLAGVTPRTARTALGRLEAMGLAAYDPRGHREKYVGAATPGVYRLHSTVYGGLFSPFAMVPATLAYGGTMRLLPSASSKLLLLVIFALDEVRDQDALRAHLREDEDEEELLDKLRRRRPASLGELAKYSGLARSTVQDALRVLATDSPTHPERTALVCSGETRNRVRYYYPDRECASALWPPEVLNDPKRLDELQGQLWPQSVKARAARRRLPKFGVDPLLEDDLPF